MQITLTAYGEELLKEQLALHAGASPEQILERALESLASSNRHPASTKTPAEGVAQIRQLRRGIRLGGLKIKDLIDDGRKY